MQEIDYESMLYLISAFYFAVFVAGMIIIDRQSNANFKLEKKYMELLFNAYILEELNKLKGANKNDND